VAIVGVITLFFGGLLALVQDDIKKVLAYSTVSQLGYMIAALGVGGYTAGIFHLFTHGFFKALLFLGSGSLIHAVHSNNMSDMGGMRKAMPHTFWTFIVGSLALAGFPLTAGFFSKDEILVAGRPGGAGFATGNLVYWVGLAAAFVTTFYMARACLLIFAGENRSHHPPARVGQPDGRAAGRAGGAVDRLGLHRLAVLAAGARTSRPGRRPRCSRRRPIRSSRATAACQGGGVLAAATRSPRRPPTARSCTARRPGTSTCS
jgi:NADH:ubiquinone oxidoreductase subunit 5 (subunit L)/multisubunit Na+/H+ antiporter MnhA subunit